ncbi:MAG TPA: hypothetical protein VHY19_00845 [Steroidobacteraceae bacterium]|nr:hypothetical protein [Steroidobacteraceae bacterium]
MYREKVGGLERACFWWQIPLRRINRRRKLLNVVHYPARLISEALLAHQFQLEIAAGMTPLWPLLECQSSFASRMRHLLRASAEWNTARRGYLPDDVRYQFSTANFDSNIADCQHRPSGA